MRRRWRDISIATRLYVVVGIMACLIIGELLTLRFAMRTLSAARAFVGGEGLWSKSQKDAVMSLQRYGRTRDEAEWQAFLLYLEVPEGDHVARIELMKPHPDLALVRRGFLAGRIEPDDIDPMIALLRRFGWTSHLSRAIAAWARADELISQLRSTGLAYHAAIAAGDEAAGTAQLVEVKRLNEDLTRIEDEFSFVLGEGSRWLEWVVLTLLCIAVVIVESVGLALATTTSRSISRDLEALNETAQQLGHGDFMARTEPRSADEIGRLARSVNRMGDMLLKSYAELEARVVQRTEELGRSRDQLRVILGGLSDGVSVIDDQERIVYLNEVGARMVGVDAARMAGQPYARFFDGLELTDEAGNALPIDRVPSQRVLRGEPGPIEAILRFRRVGGEERWVLVKAAAVDVGVDHAKLVVSIFKDYTEHRRAEDAVKFLDEASQILSSSMDYAETLRRVGELCVARLADWCWIDLVHGEGKVGPLTLTHCDPAQVDVAAQLRERYHIDAEVPYGPPQVIRTGKPELYPEVEDWQLDGVTIEDAHRQALRRLAIRSVMIVPMVAGGEVLGAITFVSAGSRRRYAAAELRLGQELGRRAAIAVENARHYLVAQRAIRQRDEFLSIASHELKTPITSLRLQLELARQKIRPADNQVPSAERLAQTFEVAGRQVDRLTRLVDDLLDVTRVGAGKLNFNFERANLSEIAREVTGRFVDQLARVGCTLRIEIADRIIGTVDANRIEQVIDNLLGNCAKYAWGKPVRLVLKRNGDHAAMLTIEDQGPGISPEVLPRIFERFERALSPTTVSGLGLGLFIVREIVRGHGGVVRAESELGQGTRFIIELPLARPEAARGA